jgi:hypothetical protein
MTIITDRTMFVSVRSAILAAAALTGLLAMPAAGADRPTDNDIKQLIERVDHDRDRFEDQLDGKLKSSTIHGARGEVNVENFLDDLQDNMQKLKDRFKSEYAASEEVTTVLRQGTAVQHYMATQPPDLNGTSEWNRLATGLNELAAAYGVPFPLPEGQMAHRMNDREVRNAAEAAAKNADRFKDELDSSLKNDTTIDKTTREAAVKDVDTLKEDAEKLSSAIGDGKPASGQAEALLEHATRVGASVKGRTLSPSAQGAWGSVQSDLDKVAQAFGKMPLAR